MSPALRFKNISVTVEGKQVVDNLNLTVKPGQIHALMGPNGSGKSSLSYAVMGHPHYQMSQDSKIQLNGVSLHSKAPDERAHEGLFLAFQYPLAIPGVSVQNALKAAYEAVHCSGCTSHDHCPKLTVTQFRTQLQATAQSLGIDQSLLTRSLNDGFSGGEKKRVEMISLLTLKPRYAILDETDSGLDVDSIKLVARAINQAVTQDHVGILIITHYRRILDYVKPDTVSIMVKGNLVKSGGPELVDHIEKSGYKSFK
jgi:Fe-S cluster assembly ATP-binding protein